MVIADINVEVAVAIDIDHRCAGAPRVSATDPCRNRDVRKVAFTKISIESVLASSGHEVEITSAIGVEVPSGDPAAAKGTGLETLERMLGIDRIDKLDSGRSGRELGEGVVSFIGL